MALTPSPVDPYSFTDLLHASRSELREQLATTVALLCDAIEHAAYLRSVEGRGSEFFVVDGRLRALDEQKWLILKLIDTHDSV